MFYDQPVWGVGLTVKPKRTGGFMDLPAIAAHLIALSMAYALAFPIGWDREKAERSAGLRTFPLVAVASCGFIQTTEALLASSP